MPKKTPKPERKVMNNRKTENIESSIKEKEVKG